MRDHRSARSSRSLLAAYAPAARGPGRRRWGGLIGVLAGAVCAAWCAAVIAASPAQAQGTGEGLVADIDQGREGYRGVKPGESTSKKKRLRPNRVTWVGFQPQNGGASRLFVQLTSEVTFTQALAGEELVIKLEGARYGSSAVGRRLDTRFFETSIAQVRARRVGKRRARRDRPAQTAGVELRIQFKNPDDASTAQASLQAEADGYHYLYLDFEPAGVRLSPER